MTQSQHPTRPKPVVLCILDGWGLAPPDANNAISQGRTPVFDRLTGTCPHTQIEACGKAVGLPDGQMGNSEVGHMNIGAGRVVMQDLPRIDKAIDQGDFASRPALVKTIDALKVSGGTCHVMGLMSPGGVHSHQRHTESAVRALRAAGIPVIIHAFLDGRDVPPASAAGQVTAFRKSIADLGEVPFGMVSGRFYAMDRDKRWDRVASACQALIDADAPVAGDPVTAIEDSYAQGITDEFVEPVVMAGYEGMKDGDGVFMINYRADRVREILLALLDPDFDGFARARTVSFAAALGMSEYSTRHNRLMRTMFPPEMRERLLGEVISKAGLKQLRVAETEKYAHVTFFFNGGREDAWPGEERILIPSPKVKTYDFQPEMSAPELTDKLVAAINADTFDLIVVNFANSDMVGHTGILSAAIKAIETVDTCIGRLETAILAKGGALVITADHGNAEVMFDPVTNGPHTAHTLNPVPVILVGGPEGVRLHTGKLADLAPTVLALMGISQPPDMTGHSLID